MDADPSPHPASLKDVTALVPARNEEEVIQRTLKALRAQGLELNVILIDDQSSDGTVRSAREAEIPNLIVLSGEPLPPGWTGKLWALEQGRRHVQTELTLLVDADIELQPGVVGKLRDSMGTDQLSLVSLMAVPRMESFWERLLMPAFVYFFKILYPFHLSNSRSPQVAAAAGGCILLRTKALEEIGGFGALREAVIDDCTLARRIKSKGYRTWIGLTRSVHSLRSYVRLREIWNMVARTAFTQLRYSVLLLLGCTVVLVAAFVAPPAGLFFGGPSAKCLSGAVLAAMVWTYLPTLKFYGRSSAWALGMPLIGMLFLAMTWTSAFRYWRGERSRWKGRSYGKALNMGR